MRLRRLHKKFTGWMRRKLRRRHSRSGPRRGPRTHVIILDGTMSSLRDGYETNAGLTYKLLCNSAGDLSIYYEPGIQFPDWRAAWAVVTGKGINRQIRRAYGYLASRYRPGDKIFLMGYSRGAYAVRSLAGLIDRCGLLKARHAVERNITLAYRHYETAPDSDAAQTFRKAFCHDDAPVEMVGVWDTVKALGIRLPLVWRLSETRHAFHNHHLGSSIRYGFHALAYDETRSAYAPVLWDATESQADRIEQVWFCGTHGDVGGQLNGDERARPLANIPLVWMLGKAEQCGLSLPQGWRFGFRTDPKAPSIGTWRSWGKMFLLRGPRKRMRGLTEYLHVSLQERLSNQSSRFSRVAAFSRGVTRGILRRGTRF